MHADTAGKYDIYSSILKRIYPEAFRFYSFSADKILAVIKKCPASSTCNLNEIYKEIEDVDKFSKASSEFFVLLHGDNCPDNIYYQDHCMKFIDFEFADFGNALIDGVYLRMFMPSCWCSKAVPPALVNKLESIYREELKKKIRFADDNETYTKQLIYSCAYWTIRSFKTIDNMGLIENEWICPSGPVSAESKWEPDKNAFRPKILSRLEAFISCTKEADYLPNLTHFTIELLSYLRKIWPETKDIDLYPVFK